MKRRSERGGLIEAQERERHRLSRELHDGLGQQLAVLSCEVLLLRKLVAGSPAADDHVRRILQHTEEIGAELHRVCRELMPLSLERLGLEAAIQRLCIELSQTHQIPIRLESGGLPISLRHDVALCVYRIVQEALRNVVKHSHAATAVVQLRIRAGELVAHVTDDGDGFNPAVARNSHGLGLSSMTERARHAGGSVTLVANPGEGTRVQARIPIGNVDKARQEESCSGSLRSPGSPLPWASPRC